ncbi:MAG: hypothetical protein LIP12_18320 [Clostridiales bacterium]|nr:hypothetical protein [Clostridiales bacterium]
MFTAQVEKRLEELDKNLVECSEDSFHLIERKKEGEAELTVKLQNASILFKSLEDKKLQYFEIKKCADFVLFECKDDVWYVHIFEMKRSIGPKSWETVKEQFAGALLNALALAGALGIMFQLTHIIVYSCYRNDKIDDSANPAKQRLRMSDVRERSPEVREPGLDWRNEYLLITLKRDVISCLHRKIKLDLETGEGIFHLHENMPTAREA